jgi:uncharacterized protein YndB with AHSA1/START domain
MEVLAYTTAKVTRKFEAAPERVFDAWLNPALMTRWFFTGPESDPIARHVENDPRVGGKWLVRDRREGVDYEADGEYVEIDRPHRLVLTFRMLQFSPLSDRIIVEIVPTEGGCQLTLTQEITVPHEDAMTPEQVEAMRTEYAREAAKGWVGMFKGLAMALEA